ncbi:MAG TPA: YihY/virulence factor BrkB family protein [Gaiellaceae bacterium]|nr:YihY/virulence factor BrkB family protein [Gaiellaceae bacterium]
MAVPEVAEARRRPGRLRRAPHDLVRSVAHALPRAVQDLLRDRCPQYAAAIAYHALFSLFPLTIVLVSVFGLVLQDDDLRRQVTGELVAVLPVSEQARRDLERSIEEIASPLSALGLISLVALLWGASGMMGAIRVGLETALKVERGRPPARAKAVDVLLVAASGLLVLVVLGLSAFAAFFGRVLERAAEEVGVSAPVELLVRDGGQLALLAATALFLYRFVPARSIGHRAAVAGAVLTALGVWAATRLLAAVFGDFSRYNLIYGSLAGVTTFLFFVYVVALIVLLGAEFAYAWAQPPGPPGPPLRRRLAGFLRGLVAYPREAPRTPPRRR